MSAPASSRRSQTRSPHRDGTCQGIALAAVVVGLGPGCGEPLTPPTISSITPSAGYSDSAVKVVVAAPGVRPAYHVDVGSGQLVVDPASIALALRPADGAAPIDLGPVTWQGDGKFQGHVPPGLDMGPYGVEITDPTGHRATLDDAFQEYGPDLMPPTITIIRPMPGDTVADGTSFEASMMVEDMYGGVAQIAWETSDGNRGNCEFDQDPTMPPPETVHCTEVFVPPPLPPDMSGPVPYSFSVTASDIAGNSQTVVTPLFVAKLPRIIDFVNTVGALAGNQAFTIHGRNFLPGTAAFIGGIPIMGLLSGGTIVDAQTITGTTPPHARAEMVQVQVKSPAGAVFGPTLFSYVAPPRIREVQPRSGRAAGQIQVTIKGNDLRQGVKIFFGPTDKDPARMLVNPMYMADDKVVGCLPPGEGAVTVLASDDITLQGSLPNAFTYDPPGTPDPGPSSECTGAAP